MTKKEVNIASYLVSLEAKISELQNRVKALEDQNNIPNLKFGSGTIAGTTTTTTTFPNVTWKILPLTNESES